MRSSIKIETVDRLNEVIIKRNLFKGDYKYVLYLTLTSILLLSIVSPFYDFPLNDDGIYYHNVKTLIETGKLEINMPGPGSSSTLMVHILYGSFFTKIFGLSYPVLRISVMLLSVIGIIGMYLLLRSINIDEKISFFGALLLLVNPFYYNLSHTFMTDVPFITLVIFAVFFYTKGFKNKNLAFLTAGNIFTLLSFGIRQFGALVFISFLMYMFIYKREIIFDSRFDLFEKFKRLLSIVILPLILFGIIFVFFRILRPAPLDVLNIAFGLRAHFLATPIYFGLFLFPFAVLYLLNWKSLVSRKTLILIILLSVLIFIPLQYWEKNIRAEYKNEDATIVNGQGTWRTWGPAGGLPLYPNIINTIGLGPVLIKGTRDVIFPDYIWVLITILSVITILFLIAFFIKNIGNWNQYSMPFVYFVGLIFLIFADALLSGIIDRYLLNFVPILIVLFMESIRKFKYVLPCLFAGLLIFGAWSVVFTYDYMEANKAKWDGINYLLNKGVRPEEINAGYEFGGIYLWDHVVSFSRNPPKGSEMLDAFYYPNATYTLSFSMLPNNSVEKKIYFNNSLRKNTIYILKRQNSNLTSSSNPRN